MAIRVGLVRALEEGGKGRVELGLGIGLAFRCGEEGGVVDQADDAGTVQAALIVNERQPLRVLGEVLLLGSGEERVEIARRGNGCGIGDQ